MRNGRIILMAALGTALAAAAVQARVFQRVGSAPLLRPDRLGTRAYETTLQINGGQALVSVAAVDGDVRALADKLAAAVVPGAVSHFVAGDEGGGGRATGAGRRAAILALSPGRGDRTLAVTVEQADADRARSGDLARIEGTTGIAGLPGSSLTCAMRNDDTRTALEVRRATVAPSTAAAYYDATLRRDGWSRLLPEGSGGGGLQVYMKGADVCCVQVRLTDPRGECQVTVVRKPGATP